MGNLFIMNFVNFEFSKTLWVQVRSTRGGEILL